MSLIPDVRFQIVKWAKEAVLNHDDWVYDEVRPLKVAWPGYQGVKKVVGDCGWFVKCCYWRAGAKDPMNTDFGPYGNTVTLFENGKEIILRQIHVGDVVTFGPGGETHAALVVETGMNPLLASFGAPGTPQLIRLNTLAEAIAATPGLVAYPETFLRFSTVNRRLSLKTLTSKLSYLKTA